MISTEEFNKVKEDFDKVISWSQGIYHPKSDQLLREWLNAKEYFIDKFGGLIWQSPEKVVFPMDPKDRDVKLNEFIENYVLYRYNNYDLARFLEQEKDGFFDNIVVGKNWLLSLNNEIKMPLIWFKNLNPVLRDGKACGFLMMSLPKK